MSLVNTWWFYITAIAQTLLALNVAIIAFKYKKLPLEIKTLIMFLSVDLLTEVVAGWFTENGDNNMVLLHVYTIIEFCTLSLFYKILLKDWRLLQRIFWVWILGIIVLLCCNTLFLESTHEFNSNAKTLVQIIMIGYAVTYFFRSFGTTDFSQSTPFACAMINSAVLIYYSGSLFVFMFSKTLNDPVTGVPAQFQEVYWLLNGILFLIFQLLIFVGLWRVVFIRKRS